MRLHKYANPEKRRKLFLELGKKNPEYLYIADKMTLHPGASDYGVKANQLYKNNVEKN